MLYESALFLVALAGSAVGGWIDLKTTEIPDIVPISMAGFGLVIHIINALYTGIWAPVYSSVAVGLLFLLFGYVLYYTGQWGEADVLLLGAVGVVIPEPLSFFTKNLFMDSGMFPAIFILNTFVVGGIYSLAYSFIIALKDKNIFPEFTKSLKTSGKSLIKIAGMVLLISFFSIMIFAGFFSIRFSPALFLSNFIFFLPAIFFVFLFYKFAQTIDTVAFKKKIKAKDLKEGDVLAEEVAGMNSKLYIGLQKEQIEKIRQAKKEVWIKEGIRYGPTFFITLVATWLYGNILALIVKII